MTLTIISVVHNADEELQATLTSFTEKLTFQPSFDVVWIVKSNGILRQAPTMPPNVQLVLNQESDTGIYNAMNVALNIVPEGLVWFVNAGDLFTDKLNILMTNLGDKSNTTLLFNVEYWSKELNIFLHVYKYQNRFIGHQSVIADVQTLKLNGGFSEKFSIFSDQFLYKSVLENNPYRTLDEAPIIMFDGGASDVQVPTISEWIAVHRLHFGRSKNWYILMLIKYVLKRLSTIMPYKFRLRVRMQFWKCR